MKKTSLIMRSLSKLPKVCAMAMLFTVVPAALQSVSAQDIAEKSLNQSQTLFNEEKFDKCIEKIGATFEAIEKDGRIRTPDELAPLYHLRARAYDKIGEYKKSMRDHREAVTSLPEDVDVLNGAAWIACTCPEAGVRDGRYALEKSGKAVRLLEKQLENLSDQDRGLAYMFQREGIANVYDTHAAALAETGDFVQAVKVQKYAVDMLTQKGNPFAGMLGANVSSTTVRDFESRLELYRTKKPYRQEKK